MKAIRSTLFALSTLAAAVAFAQEDTPDASTDADNDAAFQTWLGEFRTDALARGIRAETLDAILPTIEQQRRVIQADRNQAEFVQTYASYLERVSDRRIQMGQDLFEKEGDMINAAARAHGVQPRFVAAVLGMESNYGTFPITEPLFNVIATLAFDSRRGDQFRNELFAAFEIVDKGYAAADEMKSSWAGAIGAPQFMPGSYLRLAVDEDGDGKRDLWQMGPDVIGSVANYLKSTGWKDDQTWGRVVSLPPGGEQSLPAPQNTGLSPDATCRRYTTMGVWRELSDWQELGVRKADGSDLPTRPLAAALIIGDEGDDKGYLVYRNFCSLLRYNPSFKYALGVSLLSDAIAGIEE
ncbi:MAG: lytic murein transglycosylase [Pseudomonadales bacterium]|nr:lytic murein transglycosylase [Pseudomonadales bacterium]MCP5356598.1 lytic murein transglycosylase [Pseudomonadales bacterium]